MANSYCQGAFIVPLSPATEHEECKAAVQRGIEKARLYQMAQEILEEADRVGLLVEDFSCQVDVDFVNEGVFITSKVDEFNPEHAEIIVRELVESLELEDPVIASWAHVCDKNRPDCFGGGAFGVVKGRKTYWVDAQEHVINQMKAVTDLEELNT